MIAPHTNNSKYTESQEGQYVVPAYDEVCQRLRTLFDANHNQRSKQLIKSSVEKAMLYSLIPWSRLKTQPSTNTFGILMYHRVIPRIPGISEPTWNVTPERFEAQLSGLLKAEYQPISLSKALQHQSEQTPLPSGSFVVTFDDGYANNLEYALPVLKKLNIPATIFLATAYLNQELALPNDDWDQAGKADASTWRALTYPECHQLLDSGLIEFGSHTHTHDDFRNRPTDLAQDIQKSLQILESEFGITSPSFAFPFGTRKLGFSSDELIEAARSTGVSCSLSTEHQMVTTDQSPYEWGRFPAYQSDTAKTLAVKLSGCFSSAKNNIKQFLNPSHH